MANELRVRSGFLGGLIEDNPLSSSATTLTSAGLASVPVIGSTQHMALVFDPDGFNGAPEVVYITAHSAATTTATILRAQEGSTARAHDRDAVWVHSVTVADFARPQLLTAALSADVTLTPQNTFVDVLTLSLTPGTWRVSGCGVYQSNGGWCVLKIWDGTTTFASMTSYNGVTGGGVALTIPSVDITLAATTTIKMSGATDSSGTPKILALPPILSTGLTGTLVRLYAEKVT